MTFDIEELGSRARIKLKETKMNTSAQKGNHEILTTLERFGEEVTICILLLLFAFLIYHQAANTGFFTAKFESLEMLCLYAPLILGITAPAVRAWTGRHNAGRPFEAATSALLAAGSLWLLIIFPFSFPHLADALPVAVRFILAWVTDDIGKIILLLQIIIGPITAIFTTWKFLIVWSQEQERYLTRHMS
jgi:hypothetical protein